jgi:hypothetical protein
MPMTVRSTNAEGDVYVDPFNGPAQHAVQILIDVSDLTTDEVDSDGYLKPGVPFQEDGTLIDGSGQYVFGCNRETVRVGYDTTNLVYGNTTTILDNSDDVQVAVFTIGMVDKAKIEDNLERVLTNDEIQAFHAADCELILVDRTLNT